jgi:Flp pilus assembly protein TadD
MNENEANRCAVELIRSGAMRSDLWDAATTRAINMLRPFAYSDTASVETLTNCGAILSDIGQFAAAERLLRRAVDMNSVDRNTYLNLGVVLMNIGTHEEAQACFAKGRALTADASTLAAHFDPMAY